MQGYRNIHNDFRLNGHAFSREGLKDLAYSFVKEGEGFERAMGNFLADWLDGNETVKVTTSGSTGSPKTIGLRKEHMVNSALATGKFFGLGQGDNALLCLSAQHIAGKMMLVRALVLGLRLDTVVPSSAPLDTTSKRYDFCAMVPSQVGKSLKSLDRIKTLIVGGAPISAKLRDKLRHAACKVFETYGMTETVTHVAVRQLNRFGADVGSSEVEMPFKALPNIRFSIDERNCLIIDVPRVSDTPVVTNDVVNRISETEFEWLGRYDNVINSGGIKLHPERIEAKLSAIIPNRFFVAGLPHDELGQQLVLVVEGGIDGEALTRAIAQSPVLDKYETPRKIRVLRRFSETDSGKINRPATIDLITV